MPMSQARSASCCSPASCSAVSLGSDTLASLAGPFTSRQVSNPMQRWSTARSWSSRVCTAARALCTPGALDKDTGFVSDLHTHGRRSQPASRLARTAPCQLDTDKGRRLAAWQKCLSIPAVVDVEVDGARGIPQVFSHPAQCVGDGGADAWVGAAESLHHCRADEQRVIVQALKQLLSLGRIVLGRVPGSELELPISLHHQQQLGSTRDCHRPASHHYGGDGRCPRVATTSTKGDRPARAPHPPWLCPRHP